MAIERANREASERFAVLREQWLREGNDLLAQGHHLGRESVADAPEWPALLTREPVKESNDLIRFG
ncbi:MAG: hypothetical protein ACK58T_13285, partial [Phycisphaerae bacterium]